MSENNNILDDLDPETNFFNNYFKSMDVQSQSNYYTVESFNELSKVHTKNFSLCSYNIRSFQANSEEFFAFTNALSIEFEVIVLTETRFREGEGLSISGYDGYHSGRRDGGGGGVSIYSKNNLSVTEHPLLTLNESHIEVCTIEIAIAKRRLVVIAVYRPPSGSFEQFGESLLSILNDRNISDCELVLAGDLNFNLIDFDNATQEVGNFVHSLFSLNFMPLITKPTRFPVGNQHGSPSLLDHIWCNRYYNYVSGILAYDVSDHLPTFFFLKNLPTCGNDLVKIVFRDFSEHCKSIFINECENFSMHFSNDVNLDVEYFDSVLNNIYRRCFPIRTKFVSGKRLQKPWLTKGILNSIKEKSKLYRKFKAGCCFGMYL